MGFGAVPGGDLERGQLQGGRASPGRGYEVKCRRRVCKSTAPRWTTDLGVLYGDHNIRTSVVFALYQRRSSGELIDPARSFRLLVSLAEAALAMQVEYERHRARRVRLAVSVRERLVWGWSESRISGARPRSGRLASGQELC